MFPKAVSQKQVIVGPFGNAGKSGSSDGEGIGESEKSPSGRSMDGGQLERFIL